MGSDWLPFGILQRPHGMKGEIFLGPFNAPASGLELSARPLQVRLVLSESVVEASIADCRPAQGGFLIRFEGITTRESAAVLAGRELHLPRQAVPALAGSEFFVEDLVGCEVFELGGRRLGRVTGTFWNGGQDVMVIADDEGGEQLLPVVAEYVRSFEAARGRLVVDLHE
jgi:16S rRNA processing protein RimM